MNKRAMSAVVRLGPDTEETGRRRFLWLTIFAALGIFLLLFARMSPAMAGPPKGKEAKKVNEKVVRRGGNDDVDPEGEDANNGCGNDADRTDDNNGWCGAKPKKDHSNSHSHGTKDTGSHGTKDTGSHGTKDPGSHGTKDPVPPPGDGGGGGGRPILT